MTRRADKDGDVWPGATQRRILRLDPKSGRFLEYLLPTADERAASLRRQPHDARHVLGGQQPRCVDHPTRAAQRSGRAFEVSSTTVTRGLHSLEVDQIQKMLPDVLGGVILIGPRRLRRREDGSMAKHRSVQTMKATFDDVNLILRLYEMRREDRLRDARKWFAASFKVKTFDEFWRCARRAASRMRPTEW